MNKLRPERSDEGFSLIEVIVALALLAMVATAGLYFFVNGTRSVTEQQRTQNAVAVANEAMEVAYSVAATADAANLSGLVKGRTQSDVMASWTLATTHGVEGITSSYPVWDPAPSGSAVVGVTASKRESDMTYTTTTVIGACYRPNGSQACGRIPGVASDPGVAPAGYARLMRIMVLVTWDPTKGTCTSAPGGLCSYELVSLADPNKDLVWNNTTTPVAMNDVAEVWVGDTVEIDVLANDMLGRVTTDPIENLVMATGTGQLTKSNGKVYFTAPATPVPAASGHMTFTYRLRDQAGRTSNTATVLVRVLPKAVNDVASTTSNRPVTIPVTANDLGSAASVQITQAPGGGTTAAASGTSVVFNPQGRTGTFTFRYTFVDGAGQTSTAAQVTVNVTQVPLPRAADYTIFIPVTPTRSTTDLGMHALTGNPTDFRFDVTSNAVPTSGGLLKVNGANWSTTNRMGTSIVFEQAGNQPGTFFFSYQTVSTEDIRSTTGKITLVVMPSTATFSLKTPTTPTAYYDLPGASGSYFDIVFEDVATCDGQKMSVTELNIWSVNNGVNIVVNSGKLHNRVCTIPYILVGKNGYENVRSPSMLVRFNVT